MFFFPRSLLPCTIFLLFLSTPFTSNALEVGLDNHHIAVTTGFIGSDVILFGAVSDVGSLVIKVTGPPQKAVIRKKERILGVWANTQQAHFEALPSFYFYAAAKIPTLLPSAQLHSDLTANSLRREKVNVQDLAVHFSDFSKDLTKQQQFEYKQALISLKQQQYLYPEIQGDITFIGQELFRLAVHFPASVPIGTYKLEVLHIQDGLTIKAKTTPLIVSKEGISADIAYFAHKHSLLYGIMAISIAILSGWLGAIIFKKQ